LVPEAERQRMSGVSFTDATLTSVIRRMIVMPGMCSDAFLAMADAITEAARTAHADGRAILQSHADDLRRLARYFADAPLPARPAPPTPEEAAAAAALTLIRFFAVSARDLRALHLNLQGDAPLNRLIHHLLRNADQYEGPGA
jgi:hypothetical protein